MFALASCKTDSAAALAAALALVGWLAAAPAHALPITGTISFSGTGSPAPAGSTLETATGLSFDNPVRILTTSGDFSQIAADETDFSAFEFDSLSGPVPLWSEGGFTFLLTGLEDPVRTTVSIPSGPDILGLSLRGIGLIESTTAGLDPTEAVWTIDATDAQGGQAQFSFAAINSLSVPEPGSLALVFAGLAAVAAVRRRTKRISSNDSRLRNLDTLSGG